MDVCMYVCLRLYVCIELPFFFIALKLKYYYFLLVGIWNIQLGVLS